MSTFYKEQDKALKDLQKWHNGSHTNVILQGKAGSGKTHLVKHFLNKIPNIRPLLLAETNEAVSVLSKSTDNMYPTKTVCGALGLAIAHDKNKLVLVQKRTPDLSDFNLIVTDEISMLDSYRVELLANTGIRSLLIGHKSQLPPVDTELTVTDKCVSPIFLKNYLTFNLGESIRNTGEIAKLCDEAENLIYHKGLLPSTFTVGRNFIDSFLSNKDNINDILLGKATFLAWTNDTVALHNAKIRLALFGDNARYEDFLVTDRIICRSPTALFKHPLPCNLKQLDHILKSKKQEYETLATNTKGVVNFVTETTILGLPCYELYVSTDHYDKSKSSGIIYVAIDSEELAEYKKKYYHAALYEHDPVLADKKWEIYHRISLLFSNTLHAYARTIHSSQGTTLDTVIIDDADINKCTNPILKKKLRYVGYSRAKKHLHRLL